MRINCRILNGRTCTIVVPDSGCTVMRLKCIIAQLLKARLRGVWTMHLYHTTSTEMQDANSLSSYGIINNSSITMVLKVAENIRIKAVGPGGECFLTLPSISTVAHLKEIYERRCSLDCKKHGLQIDFKGKKLPSHTSLAQAGICHGTQVIIRSYQLSQSKSTELRRPGRLKLENSKTCSKNNLVKALEAMQL